MNDPAAEIRRKIRWHADRHKGPLLLTDLEIIVTPRALSEILSDARTKPALKLQQHGLEFDGVPLRVAHCGPKASISIRRMF